MTDVRRRAAAQPHVHPTQEDPVVGALSECVGGPVGSRAGRARRWTPLRVLLAITAVGLALGMVQKAPCAVAKWPEGRASHAAMCYSDLPYLYVYRGLAEHNWPYSQDPQVRARYQVMEYPVGIAYWAWATSWTTRWLNGSPNLDSRYQTPPGELFGDPEVQREISWFATLNALGFALAALATTWLLARTHPRRPWDAAVFAASPAVALTALINWDLLAVVLVAAALWAWSRDRPLLTGVLVGAGTATKLYPLFLLGGLLVICVRERRWRELGTATAAATVAWLVLDAPAMLTGYDAWTVFWTFNSGRGPDLGSIWLVLDQAGGLGIGPGTLNVWQWALFLLWCAGVAAVGVLAPRTPRLAQLGFLVVAGFLLFNKVYSPQYVLWLLPLAALARPRWRDQIVWQSTEVLYFAFVWWYLGGFLEPAGGGDSGFYWVAIVVRMLGELYLVALVTRDVLRPEHDPVRSPVAQLTSTRSNVVAV